MFEDRLHCLRRRWIILQFKLSDALSRQDLVDVTSCPPSRGVRCWCPEAHGVDWIPGRLYPLLLKKLLPLLIEIANHPVNLDRVLPLLLNLIINVSNICTVEVPYPLCWVLQDNCHPPSPRLIAHSLIVFLDR